MILDWYTFFLLCCAVPTRTEATKNLYQPHRIFYIDLTILQTQKRSDDIKSSLLFS